MTKDDAPTTDLRRRGFYAGYDNYKILEGEILWKIKIF